jgi:predicted TIM-barrel fold metal-dependent hydrolase
MLRLPDGGDAWLIEGRPLYRGGVNLCAGKPFEEWNPKGMTYEGAPGAGSPEQRLLEQDIDGIDAEILFPGNNGGMIVNSIPDDDAYLAMVRAYNDFLVEDYCAVAPDRLLGMGVIPERGVRHAIDEMERCARMGMKGVVLSTFPSGKYHPTPEDDEFWAAALDLAMPVTVHVQFGARGARTGPIFKYPLDPGEDIGGQDIVSRMTRYGQYGALSANQLVMARVFDRFPNLRVYFAENQIGWIPNHLEQMDIHYNRHRFWAQRLLGIEPFARPPSEIVKEHFLWGFQDNPVGVAMRHYIGVDHVMWANDFPHAESDWPNSRDVLKRNFAGVPEDETYKMVAGNAIDFFHLDTTRPLTETPESAAVATQR